MKSILGSFKMIDRYIWQLQQCRTIKRELLFTNLLKTSSFLTWSVYCILSVLLKKPVFVGSNQPFVCKKTVQHSLPYISITFRGRCRVMLSSLSCASVIRQSATQSCLPTEIQLGNKYYEVACPGEQLPGPEEHPPVPGKSWLQLYSGHCTRDEDR